MAVHFDFIVSDEEAETIMECIREEINQHRELLLEVDLSGSHREWYEGRIKYLESLIAKMTNQRIDDAI